MEGTHKAKCGDFLDFSREMDSDIPSGNAFTMREGGCSFMLCKNLEEGYDSQRTSDNNN